MPSFMHNAVVQGEVTNVKGNGGLNPPLVGGMDRCMVGWRRVLGFGVIALLAVACGAAKPAESADDADRSAEQNTEVNDEAASGANDVADNGGDSAGHGDESAVASGSQSGESASADDVQAVLQLVIDDDALQPFLHLEEPGRFPLRIAFGADVQNASGVALTKMTKPVEIVDSSAAADPKKPAIVITALSLDGDHARVTYRYKVENVHGTATLAKAKNGHWELVNSTLTER